MKLIIKFIIEILKRLFKGNPKLFKQLQTIAVVIIALIPIIIKFNFEMEWHFENFMLFGISGVQLLWYLLAILTGVFSTAQLTVKGTNIAKVKGLKIGCRIKIKKNKKFYYVKDIQGDVVETNTGVKINIDDIKKIRNI